MNFHQSSATEKQNCVPWIDTSSNQQQYDLFIEGDLLYSEMLKSIQAAKHSIRMESYIFAAVEIGCQFADALVQQASRGVDVKLHIDAVGSYRKNNRELCHFLRKHRVQLKYFHRWRWDNPWRYNRRSHRKLLVIDDDEMYLGGFNIHRENSLLTYGQLRWRDTHIRLVGALAQAANLLFDQFWREQRKHVSYRSGDSSLLLPNDNRRCRVALHCLLQMLFAKAQSSIYITTPYFVPDRKIQHALITAAKRGVAVHLLVPDKSDVMLAKWAAQAAYASLLSAGVRIYEYTPRMLHAKTIVIDDEWSMVGTSNLDYRSFFLNYELNIISRNRVIAENLFYLFDQDFKTSVEIHQHTWVRRYWHRYVFETISWLARRWL